MGAGFAPNFLAGYPPEIAKVLNTLTEPPRWRFRLLPPGRDHTSLGAMTETPREVHFLDRPAARLWAVGVALLMAAALAFMHRDDILPPQAAEGPAADDPVMICFAERAAEIDQMVADGIVNAQQAELFKSRAEALCQAQLGGGSGPPPPPQ